MDDRAATLPAPPADLGLMMERLFLFEAVESSYPVTGIEGQIPGWLRGSYYLNGPARFQRDGRRCRNWLDGDGMVCALHFGEDGVRWVSRFIRTRKLRDEEAAGAFLYRGFGTAFPGDRLRRGLMLESPVNLNIFRWGDRLLAFGEQALPVRLDPDSLDTLGEFDFDQQLNEVSPFSAHAKVDPANGHLVNFGISFSPRRPVLYLYEFGASGKLLSRRRVPLDLQYANHDFTLSRRHAVFFLSPFVMDFERFRRDGVSVMDSLAWEPQRGSQILAVPRDPRGAKAFAVPAGQGYCLHLINAFEEGRELVVDILELERPLYPEYQPLPDLFATAPPCLPVRYTLDLETHSLRDRRPLPYGPCADFPSIAPHRLAGPYQDFWALGISASGTRGRKFFDHLAHGSWTKGTMDDRYRAPAGECLAGQPVFLANPEDPDDGLVMVQHLAPSADRAALALFPALAVHRGPVIRIPLRDRLHPLFHAAFHPAAPPSG